MRNDVSFDSSFERQRSVEVILHPTATFVELIAGTSVDDVDLTPYVSKAAQTDSSANITLRWEDSSFFDIQPRPGNLLSIKDRGVTLFNGVVDSLTGFREQRGARSMQVVVRGRDGTGPWRGQRITSNRFPVGTQLSSIAEDLVISLGLDESEYVIPTISLQLPHSSTQFADETPWSILQSVYMTGGHAPYTDSIGRIRHYSRDFARPPDIMVPISRVVSIGGTKHRPSVTRVRVKWLDPILTEVVQQSQVLGTESITAGFFRRFQKRNVYWSDDQSQRARNTFMRIEQSVNGGLLPVGSEEYEEQNEYHGEIKVTTNAWVPGLATASVAAMLALDWLPDGVVTAGFVASGGETIPYGRAARGIAEAALLVTMMSLGSGTYEVWGQPYDFVHHRNTTEAFNDAAPQWAESIEDIENDMIATEAQAQQLAARELIFRSAESSSWGVEIVDDLRIEVGDILQISDIARIFVTGYSRDVTPGSAATMRITGLRV